MTTPMVSSKDRWLALSLSLSFSLSLLSSSSPLLSLFLSLVIIAPPARNLSLQLCRPNSTSPRFACPLGPQQKHNMRYGPNDFNYTFVSTEEDKEASADAGGDVEEGLVKNEEGEADEQVAKAGGSKKPASKSKADDPLRRSSRAADESTKPYVYVPPKKYGLGGGRGADGLSDDDVLGGGGGSGGAAEAMAALIGGSGACCCCISATLIMAGGIMLAYERYDRRRGRYPIKVLR